MITCINLSKPRKVIKSKYDDIMLGYKLSYSKDEIEKHKRIVQKIGVIVLMLVVKHILFDMRDVAYAKGGNNTANDLFKNPKQYYNSFDELNVDMNKEWDKMIKGTDDLLKPTNDYVDKVLKVYTDETELVKQEFERLRKLTPSQRLYETSHMDIGKMMKAVNRCLEAGEIKN